MSDAVKVDLPTEAKEPTRKDHLKGSLMAVQETQKLLRTGHFAGARAHKIALCLGYLGALETQIKSQIEAEK